MLVTAFLIWVSPQLARAEETAAHRPFPAEIPMDKPADRPPTADMERLYDVWNPLGDRDNELYSNFKYSRLEGLQREQYVAS